VVVHWSQSVKLLYVAPVSTGMCDRLRVGKPPRFVTSHSGPLKATQSSTLSLLPLVFSGMEMSTDKSAVTLCGWQVKAGMVHSACG